ncbi:bacteriocin [Sphingobacterium siyangense]|jgi:bacteriocin-like protein|uniref:bacteriocin n=1 Tax=Sphingobacterium siyangense TaxID=459529 RepID=UPI003DA238A7
MTLQTLDPKKFKEIPANQLNQVTGGAIEPSKGARSLSYTKEVYNEKGVFIGYNHTYRSFQSDTVDMESGEVCYYGVGYETIFQPVG